VGAEFQNHRCSSRIYLQLPYRAYVPYYTVPSSSSEGLSGTPSMTEVTSTMSGVYFVQPVDINTIALPVATRRNKIQD